MNAQTKNVNWSTEEYFMNAEPAIHNNIVYIGKMNELGPSYIIGYDLTTGKEVYKLDLDRSLVIRSYTSNLIVTDKYIFALTESKVLAIDRIQKKILWTWATESYGANRVRLTYNNETLYADTGIYLCAIDCNTGKPIWKSDHYKGNQLVNPSATLYKNFIYLSAGPSDNQDEPLYAFDRETGVLKWKNDEAKNAYSVVIHENSLFVGTRQGNFYALDPVTGSTQWSINLNSLEFFYAPCVSGNYAFIANGVKLYAIDIKARKVSWTYSLDSPPLFVSDPVAANDKVYIKSSKLYAFDIYTGIPEIISSPDPKYPFGGVPVTIIDSNKKIHCSLNSEMKSQY